MTHSTPIKDSLGFKLSSVIESPQSKNNILSAAVSLVLVEKNHSSTHWKDFDILLMQRAFHQADPWSGHLAFPGGGVELEDANTLETAIRETSEEMGFQLPKESWQGAVQPVYGPVIGDKKTVHLFPHVFLLNQAPELNINEEAQAAYWVSIDRLSQMKYVNSFTHPSIPDQQMYGIDIGKNLNVFLWGLTLEVLYRFFETVQWPVEQKLQAYV